MKNIGQHGEVSMLTVPSAGWEMKIGAAQASSTEKRGFGTAKWLAKFGQREYTRETAKNVHCAASPQNSPSRNVGCRGWKIVLDEPCFHPFHAELGQILKRK